MLRGCSAYVWLDAWQGARFFIALLAVYMFLIAELQDGATWCIERKLQSCDDHLLNTILGMTILELQMNSPPFQYGNLCLPT